MSVHRLPPLARRAAGAGRWLRSGRARASATRTRWLSPPTTWAMPRGCRIEDLHDREGPVAGGRGERRQLALTRDSPLCMVSTASTTPSPRGPWTRTRCVYASPVLPRRTLLRLQGEEPPLIDARGLQRRVRDVY